MNLKGRTILVVDDHPVNQKLMEGMLSRTGAEVLCAEDGNEAVTVFRNHPEIDVILMDVHMPGMSGLEAVRKIRSEFPEKQSEVIILAVTASVMSSDVKGIKDAGMDDYLAKPFTYREFVDKVTAFLDEKERQGSAASDEISKIPKQETGIDVTALRDMAGGDVAMMLELIELFLEQTPILLKKMKSACDAQDWQKLSEYAHKLKPTFNYMGMAEAFDISEKLETFRDRPTGKTAERAKTLLDRLTELARKSYPDLKTMAEMYRKQVN
jgi:CheY-like chemotaxis protein